MAHAAHLSQRLACDKHSTKAHCHCYYHYFCPNFISAYSSHILAWQKMGRRQFTLLSLISWDPPGCPLSLRSMGLIMGAWVEESFNLKSVWSYIFFLKASDFENFPNLLETPFPFLGKQMENDNLFFERLWGDRMRRHREMPPTTNRHCVSF